MTHKLQVYSIALLVFIAIQFSCAQNKKHEVSARQDISLLLNVLKDNLAKQYFDRTMADHLTKELVKMEGEKLFEGVSAEVAAQMITDMLRRETHDKHFNVIAYNVNPVNKQTALQKIPFTGGITSVKILKNNIGYIKWDACIAGQEALKKIRNALDSVAACKKLIIDITDNPGGDGTPSAFINQFLYKSKDYQTLLIKKCTGETNWHQSEVIFNYNDGPTFFNIPLFIIVSDRTFSAAEYFCFTAKEMKRAIILGKTTGGGGNPGNAMSFSLSKSETAFWMFIPNCQITTRAGHSIEGVGVKPDVELKTADWVNETVEYIMKSKI